MSEYGSISMPEYIEILFRDLGYHESSQRRGWFKLRFDKSYVDELTPKEQYEAVRQLRFEKYGEE